MSKAKVVVYGLGQGFEGFLNFFNGDYAEIVACVDQNAERNKYAAQYPAIISGKSRKRSSRNRFPLKKLS